MIEMLLKEEFAQNFLRTDFEEKTKDIEGLKIHFYEELNMFKKEKQRQSLGADVIVLQKLSAFSEQHLLTDTSELKLGMYIVFTADEMIISKIDSSINQTPQKIIRVSSEKANMIDVNKFGAYFTRLSNDFRTLNKKQPLQKDTLQKLFKSIFDQK